MLDMVGALVGGLARSTQFDADVRCIRACIEVLDKVIVEIETKDPQNNIKERLRQDFDRGIEKFFNEIAAKEDFEEQKEMHENDENNYWNLALEISPKLIQASTGFLLAHTKAITYLQGYQ